MESPETNTQYSIEFSCQNCHFPKYYTIQTGEKVKDFLSSTICEECGCNVVEEREDD